MAKAQKTATPAPKAEETTEITNTAETTIVPDVVEKSTRKSAPAAASGEMVTLLNKKTGFSHKLPAKEAIRLAKNESDKYTIVKDGEGK